MRRWFPRKDKDQEKALEGREAPPGDETTAGAEPEEAICELPPEAAAEIPESLEGEAALSTAEPAAEVFNHGLPVSPAEGAEMEGGPRPGFFRRIFKGPESSTLEASCAEALVLQKAAQEGEPQGEEEVPPEAEPAAAAGAAPETESREEEAAPPEAEHRGLMGRLRERLSRTRDSLAGGLDRILRGRREIDAELLEALEELLITADLGVETTLHLIGALQEKLRRRELGDVARLKQALRQEMTALLTVPAPREITSRPWVVLMVGVNGVGKTTTIAKLAHMDRARGFSPLLVAADTFRAAAAEQLEIWGERVGAPVVRQKAGADPAAVVFDGLSAALARDAEVVYVDTAGRLHTKVNLMEELKKIQRTAAKKIPDAPHEVLLVLDATTGQNALSQARLFHEAVAVTGIILTKMDGTAKGGVALAVAYETGIPIRYLGVGEGMDDLRPFDAETFVEAILG